MVAKNQKFQIEFDGIALPDEVVQRIDAALRKAVLAELATLQIGGPSTDLLSQGFEVRSLGAPGHTQGLRVRAREA